MRSPLDSTPRSARLGSGLCMLMVAGLSACTAQLVDVHAEDTSVLSTDARVSWELGGDDESATAPATESAAEPETEPAERPSVSIELDISHSGGAADQISLPPGQAIWLGGQLHTGDLEAEYDLTRIMVDVRVSSPPRNGFRVEGFGGFEWSSLDFTLRQNASPAKETDSGVNSLGLAFGAALAYEPRSWVCFSTEGRVSYGVSGAASTVEQYAFDIGVALYPFESVGVYGGWRNLGYEAEIDEAFSADLDLRLAGPVLGLRVNF